MYSSTRWTAVSVSLLPLIVGTPVMAQTDGDRIRQLEAQVSAMAQELAALRSELENAKQARSSDDPQPTPAAINEVRQAAEKATESAKSANEWKHVSSVQHLAGYASASYIDPENANSAFIAGFNPIFHYLALDKVLWEAEVEIELEEDGETAIELEYSAIDLFLSNNLTLTAGKFLSPIGNFRQNLHPTWINKFPSMPPGFGHDGAAPVSEVGFQLRGAAPFGNNRRLTYAAYVGNGPQLEGEDGEIHGIEAEGFAADPDDEKVFGGRIGFLPVPELELAVSGAFGEAAVVRNDEIEIEGDPSRDYTVLGFDGSYRWRDFAFRGEYVKQKVDSQELSVAPEGDEWEAWYAQGAYRFGQDKWEGVVRYTDFNSPHPDDSQEQWAFGVNYLLTQSAMVKFGYEANSGETGEVTDDDRLLVQIAYGY